MYVSLVVQGYLRRITVILLSAAYSGGALASAVHQINHDQLGRITQFEVSQFSSQTFEYLDTGAAGANGQHYKTQRSDGNVNFSFDVLGRVTKMQDGEGYTFYDYADQGYLSAVVRSSDSVKGNADDKTIGYTRDNNGQLTQLVYPDGETIQYSYDPLNSRLTTVNNVTNNEVLTYNYNTTTGLVDSITRNNGFSLEFDYDQVGRLIKKTWQHGGQTISFEINLDTDGNVQWLKKTANGSTSMEQYSYNDQQQVTKVVYSTDTVINEATDRVVKYSYDLAYKRTSLQETTAGNTTRHLTYQYNNANQLQTITNVLKSKPYATLSWDSAGNLKQKIQGGQTTTYDWYQSGLLRQVSEPGLTVSYTYDGKGNRLSKTVNGITTDFVVDTARGLPSAVQAYQGSTLLSSLSDTGQTLQGNRRHALTDFLGSPRYLTNTSLSIIDSEDYDIYGSPLDNGLTDSPVQFIGEQYDAEVGLSHLRARYYSPDLGIFISQDPIGFSGGSYLHGYALANPVSLVDRTGNSPKSAINAQVFPYTNGHSYVVTDDGRHFIRGPNGNIVNHIRNASPIRNNNTPSTMGSKQQVTIPNVGTFPISSLLDVNPNGSVYGPVEERVRLKRAVESGGVITKVDGELLFPEDLRTDLYLRRVTVQFDGQNYGHTFYLFDNLGIPTHNYNPAPRSLPKSQSFEPSSSAFPNRVWGDPSVANLNETSFHFDSNSDVIFRFPGGVLLDGTAALIDQNLANITGATYDPITQELIFLGVDGGLTSTAVNMDYFHTAIQAVFGSAIPPFVSLDPAARPEASCNTFACINVTNASDQDGIFENGEQEGLLFNYVPFWSGEDNWVDIRVRAHNVANPAVTYDWTQRLNASANCSIKASGRCLMQLSTGILSGAPAGISTSVLQQYGGFSLGADGQDSQYAIIFANNSAPSMVVDSVSIVPERQHRRFGGRIEQTRLGWVMYEADRVMKALAVGKESLTGTMYDSESVNVGGYQNMLQRFQANGESRVNARMWFTPNDLTLRRSVDSNGQATMLFSDSSVQLQTESNLFSGQSAGKSAEDFASHFTSFYEQFAKLDFPVQSPQDGSIIQVKIFEELRQVMEAVALARFLRDNNIPLDMWWLDTYEPQEALVPRSTDSAINEINSSGFFVQANGGAQWFRDNSYVTGDDSEAMLVGDEAVSARPSVAEGKAGDVQDNQSRVWSLAQGQDNYRAVSASVNSRDQTNTQQLTQVDLSYPSAAGRLGFVRYHHSQLPVNEGLGEGWMLTPARLLFSRPSWFDTDDQMQDNSGAALSTLNNGDTQLRSGKVVLLSGASGAVMNFESSMTVSYSGSDDDYSVSVSGLTGENGLVPEFAPGDVNDGSTLVQRASDKGYLLTDRNGKQMLFDAEGKLYAIDSGLSPLIQYTYNTIGRLTSISDGAQTLNLTYTDDKVSSITGPGGEQVTYSYIGDLLTRVTHVRSGDTVSYDYDADNRVVMLTTPDDRQPAMAQMDNRGRATLQQDLAGNRTDTHFLVNTFDGTRTTYTKDAHSGNITQTLQDAQDRILSQTSATGLTSSAIYSGGNLYPSTVVPGIPDAIHPGVTQTYNSFGQVTSSQNLGNTGAGVVTYTYDSEHGQVLTATDEMGNVTRYTYYTFRNSDGVLLDVRLFGTFFKGVNEQSESLLRINEYYTAGVNAGKLSQVKNANNQLLAQYSYYTNGQLASMTDSAGLVTSYQYDSQARLFRVYPPHYIGSNDYIQYGYNDGDRVTHVTSPLGTTVYGYAANGDLVSVTTPSGNAYQFSYSPVTGKLEESRQLLAGSDAITRYRYDRFGLMAIIAPDGYAQRYLRNDLGLTTQIAWGYDSDGDALFDTEESIYGTVNGNADSDNDGIFDGIEALAFGSAPNNSDADSDGVSDYDELFVHFTDPNSDDTDGDGINDGDEVNFYKSDPTSSDTDNDGLSDAQELLIYSTDPNLSDSDGDGLSDFDEILTYNTNATQSDEDNDGLNDRIEVLIHNTESDNPDTDGDGINDGHEVAIDRNPLVNEAAVLKILEG